MRHLYAGNAARGPRLGTAVKRTDCGRRARGARRESVSLYGLHEDHRRGFVMHEVTFLRPKDLQDAVRLYRTTPGCRPLAGGTDLMVMLQARTLRPQPRAVLDIWSLAELKGVRRHNGMLEIGAAESYTGIIRSREAHQHVPALVAAARTIGAAQIQNRGTLGGNLANASPAGDTLPILLAYDAVVVTDRRSIPIDQFFIGYRKTALQPGAHCDRLGRRGAAARPRRRSGTRARGCGWRYRCGRGRHPTDRRRAIHRRLSPRGQPERVARAAPDVRRSEMDGESQAHAARRQGSNRNRRVSNWDLVPLFGAREGADEPSHTDPDGPSGQRSKHPLRLGAPGGHEAIEPALWHALLIRHRPNQEPDYRTRHEPNHRAALGSVSDILSQLQTIEVGERESHRVSSGTLIQADRHAVVRRGNDAADHSLHTVLGGCDAYALADGEGHLSRKRLHAVHESDRNEQRPATHKILQFGLQPRFTIGRQGPVKLADAGTRR